MKVIVFGATGSVGYPLLQQALDQGHQVTAFCRTVEKLKSLNHPQLSIHRGDVFKSHEVQAAIKGQELVIVCLGSGNSRRGTVRSQGTKKIITAMQQEGVQRLICQTTLGAGQSRSNLNFFWKYIMFGWLLKEVYKDHELQEAYVKNSNLDWTIIRPGAFTNGSKTGKYRHGFSHNDRSVNLKISRADVADFILKQFHSKEYLFQTPGLSY